MNGPDEIYAVLHIVYARLDTLARISSVDAPLLKGSQAGYHEIIEDAYAALSRVETAVDALRTELEYQHQRLDEIIASAHDATPEKGK